MAVTNWAALINAAHQKLVNANASAALDTQQANDLKIRQNKADAKTNKNTVGAANIADTDRGMAYSGAHIQRQNDIANTYATQMDLTKRNNVGTLAKIAQNKLAAKTTYDQSMAQIKAAQAAESMSRIAQLPAGINFAALKAMNGKK